MRPLVAGCLFILGSACSGPRVVLGGGAQSVTASSHPTQPPVSVAQHLDAAAAAPAPAAKVVYVCPMHPEVTSDDPNARCPKCGMKLEAKK